MNERIKQLREQALRWSGKNVNRNLYSNYEIEQKEYNKFAELIIQECANYIRENYDSWDAEPLAHNLEVDFGLHGDYAERI